MICLMLFNAVLLVVSWSSYGLETYAFDFLMMFYWLVLWCSCVCFWISLELHMDFLCFCFMSLLCVYDCYIFFVAAFVRMTMWCLYCSMDFWFVLMTFLWYDLWFSSDFTCFPFDFLLFSYDCFFMIWLIVCGLTLWWCSYILFCFLCWFWLLFYNICLNALLMNRWWLSYYCVHWLMTYDYFSLSMFLCFFFCYDVFWWLSHGFLWCSYYVWIIFFCLP